LERQNKERKGFERAEKMTQKRKTSRMKQFITTMMQENVPVDFKPASWSASPNPSNMHTQ
jgi:hypothetical protein